MACGDLIQSEPVDCNNPLQSGVGGDSRLVLINFKDVLGYVATGVDIISAITLAANKSAFAFEGIKQSLKPKFERGENASGQTVFKHIVEFFIFSYSQITKNNLLRMGGGRYIGIYENAKKDANSFEILGADCGLVLQETSRAPGENGGAIRVLLNSAENEFEAKPPRTFFVTDYTATKALIDGYLFLPTIGPTGLSVTAAAAAGGTALTVTGTNFFGGGSNSAVLTVQYINNLNGAVVNQAAFTVTATTVVMTGGTPAMAAGNYRVKITTTKGFAESAQNLIVT
jgi:hypothetical protein